MKQPIATLCSFALMLWAYQTGFWVLAVPLILMLEARGFIAWRGKVSQESVQFLHVLAALLWVITVVSLPWNTPSPVQYAARYQLLRGLPIALSPIILVHTYSTNLQALYGTLFLDRRGNERKINLYVLYFGLCLLSASVTGGSPWVFGAVAIILAMGLLLTYQSSRHSSWSLVGLMVGALAMSLLASTQLNWFHSNVKLQNPLTVAAQSLVQLWDKHFPSIQAGFDPNLDWSDVETLPEIEAPFDLSQVQEEFASSHAPQEPLPNLGSNDVSSPEQSSSNSPFSSDDFGGESPNSGESSALENVSEPGDYPVDDNPFDSAAESTRSGGRESELFPSGGDSTAELPAASSTSREASQNTVPWGTQGTPTLAQSRQAIASVVDPEQAKTRIGSLGALQQSNAILFRIRPGANTGRLPLPLYMREATYDAYAQGAWNAKQSGFSDVPLSSGQWSIGEPSGQVQNLQISGLQQLSGGLLKLPMGTVEVNGLPINRLQVNRYGTAMVPAGPKRSLSYGLRFDPRNSLDQAPTPKDLTVPPQEREALTQILNGLKLDGLSEPAKVRALERFFQNGFVYSLELVPPEKGKSPLASFLLKHRSGHCEYYASATTLLLREAGIPARYTVGYSVSERGEDGEFLVRLRDAHAWVTAYIDGAWKTLDTTPGDGAPQLEDALGDTQAFEQAVAEQIAQEQEQGESESALEQGTDMSYSDDADGPIQDAMEELEEAAKPGWDWFKSLMAWGREIWTESFAWTKEQIGSNIWFASFFALGVAIAVTAMIMIVRLLRKQKPRWLPRAIRSRKAQQYKSVGFRDIEAYLDAQNLGRGKAETPKRWLLRLEQTLPQAQVESLQRILDLHYRDRFDPEGLSAAEKSDYLQEIKVWLDEVRSPQAQKRSMFS